MIHPENMARLFALLAAILASIAIYTRQSRSEVRVTHDEGGVLAAYVHHYERLRQEGETVVIDGPCFSACTVALMLAPERICATPRASLHFHSPYVERGWGPWKRREPMKEHAEYMLSLYPDAVQAWIAERGGLRPDYISLRTPELWSMVRRCSEDEAHGGRDG